MKLLTGNLNKYERKTLQYNGYDCMVTREVHPVFAELLTAEQRLLYRAYKALQAPAMAIGLRGWRVNEEKAKHYIRTLTRGIDRYAHLVQAQVQHALSWTPTFSGKDFGSLTLQKVFYGPQEPELCPQCSGTLKVVIGEYKTGARKGQPKTKICPECKGRPSLAGFGMSPITKAGKPTLDAGALEKLINRRYPSTSPAQIARAVLALRGLKKEREALLSKRGLDGRFHFELAFGATVTERTASKKAPDNTGGNSQNFARRRLDVFIPDPGYYFLGYDERAAESHILARISNDLAMIEAHEGPLDPHTYVAKLVWPHLAWPADPGACKRFAEDVKFASILDTPVAYTGSLRDMAKKLNHAAGRKGTSHTIARNARIPIAMAKEILYKRFWGQAFPTCWRWMADLQNSLKRNQTRTIPGLNVQRHFFSRPWDEETFRDLLAWLLQAPCAFAAHIGFWRIWRDLDSKSLVPGTGDYQLVAHRHDQIMTQVRDTIPPAVAKAAIEPLGLVPLPICNPPLTIPIEVKVGTNMKEVK